MIFSLQKQSSKRCQRSPFFEFICRLIGWKFRQLHSSNAVHAGREVEKALPSGLMWSQVKSYSLITSCGSQVALCRCSLASIALLNSAASQPIISSAVKDCSSGNFCLARSARRIIRFFPHEVGEHTAQCVLCKPCLHWFQLRLHAAFATTDSRSGSKSSEPSVSVLKTACVGFLVTSFFFFFFFWMKPWTVVEETGRLCTWLHIFAACAYTLLNVAGCTSGDCVHMARATTTDAATTPTVKATFTGATPANFRIDGQSPQHIHALAQRPVKWGRHRLF